MENLMFQEISKLKIGIAVLPFLSHQDYILTKQEVIRLANGFFDERAKSFLANREENVRKEFPSQMSDFLQRIKSINLSTPKALKKIRTFNDCVSYFRADFPEKIREISYNKFSLMEAKKISENLDDFPVFHSLIMATVYLNYIPIAKKAIPNDDKLDDYRHIAEASYCNAILTNDKQLGNTVRYINGNIDVIKSKDL